MVSIGTRFLNAATSTVFQTPKVAVTGALVGYIYGKLANLPAGQLAKAWAIWNVANLAIETFVDSIIEEQSRRGGITRAFVKLVLFNASTGIYIHELRKRGLLGDKMMFAMITIQALANLAFIFDANLEVDANDHQFNGFGKRTSSDGTHYRGQFKNGQPHGKGILTYSNGHKILGTFEYGKLKTPEKN